MKPLPQLTYRLLRGIYILFLFGSHYCGQAVAATEASNRQSIIEHSKELQLLYQNEALFKEIKEAEIKIIDIDTNIVNIEEDEYGTEFSYKLNPPPTDKNAFTINGKRAAIILNKQGFVKYVALSPYNQKAIDLLSTLDGVEGLRIHGSVYLDKKLDLSKLTSLKDLYLNENNILELKLPKSNKLQVLKLFSIPVKQLDLSGIRSLKNIDISDHNIESFSNIAHLTNLESLTLIFSSSLKSIDDVSQLKSLKRMYVASRNIQIIPGLENLSNLTYLKLSSSSLNKGNQKQAFPTSLQHLVMNNNELTNLAGLINLKALNLSGSELKVLDFPFELPSLETLKAHNAKIEKIKDISKLTHLKELSLVNNKITTIENLDQNPLLERVILNDNLITHAKNFNNIKRLKYLGLMENPITEYDLNETKNLGDDVHIRLSGTPYKNKLGSENKVLYYQLRRKNKI